MRIDALLWLVSLLCLVGLGDVLAREPYADYQFRGQTQNRSGLQQDRYRWRPLNEEEEKLIESSAEPDNARRPNQSTLYPSSVIDYAEAPPGLPRGVYRPVEERHTITPHMDGFRFRELTPDEQLRIKRRNEIYNQAWQPDRSENRSILSSGGYSQGQPEIQRQGTYKFRPDKRLDKKRGGNWGRSQSFPYNPAFTEAYQTPMFRPE
ncbi:MAG: hypothetical protein ABW094_02130 [Candidatus Thiodiazotropha sp.]